MKKLGFGCIRLPMLNEKDHSTINIETTKKMVDTYLENGFNYFDTAYKYCGGNSETVLREALVERYPRESFILTTKLSSEFMHSKEEKVQAFNDQFKRLGVEYFDYYLLHNIGIDNYEVAQELDSFTFKKKRKKKVWLKT